MASVTRAVFMCHTQGATSDCPDTPGGGDVSAGKQSTRPVAVLGITTRLRGPAPKSALWTRVACAFETPSSQRLRPSNCQSLCCHCNCSAQRPATNRLGTHTHTPVTSHACPHPKTQHHTHLGRVPQHRGSCVSLLSAAGPSHVTVVPGQRGHQG